MYYTDYQKKQIFTDRQTAILSSRMKAKDEFFSSLVSAEYWGDDYEGPGACIVRHVTDYKDIKDAFDAYEKNRSTIYEVQIRE